MAEGTLGKKVESPLSPARDSLQALEIVAKARELEGTRNGELEMLWIGMRQGRNHYFLQRILEGRYDDALGELCPTDDCMAKLRGILNLGATATQDRPQKREMLVKGRHPFERSKCNVTGKEQIHAEVRSPEDPPTRAGQVLVRVKDEITMRARATPSRLFWETVTIYEDGSMFFGDSITTTPSEWVFWIDLSTRSGQ